MAPVAVAFAVLDLTGSAGALGLVLAARSIPQVAFMLAGGVIADRFDRTTVLVLANVVAASAQAVTALLLLTGTASLPALVALQALNGSATALVFPAASAITPQMVPSGILQQANAMIRLALNGAIIVGASIGGLLVGYFGPGWGLAVDACTYLTAAWFFSRMGRAPLRTKEGDDADLPRRGAVSGVFTDLRDGWREVMARTWLWPVIVAFGFANAAQAAGWQTLGPVVAEQTFGPQGWGFILAAQTAGMFVGAMVLMRLRPRRPLFVGCAAMLLWTPMLLALALDPRLATLLITAFIAGLGLETFVVFWDLSLQQNVPIDRLSRVYSFDAVGSYAMIPLGQLVAGPLAVLVGIKAGVLICAAVIFVTMLSTILVRPVRKLERTDSPSPATAPS
jgi:MFS family permease